MSRSACSIEPDAFLSKLRDRTASGIYAITLAGGSLPVSVHLQESPYLVFTFSGAVDRSKNPLPFFVATGLHTQVPSSIIAISDPSLARHDEMRLAWYAGHEGFELQKLLPELIRQMIESLDADRVAFVGGSGGGFAALYYAWQIPGSVVVVSNPQTNLDRAIQAHRVRYRDACWPSLRANASFSKVVESDLGALYAQRCDNFVVYLQEASDFLHLKWHFSPFVASLPREYASRLVVRMSHWGRRGHQAVPPKIWISWLRAALDAPELTAISIEETWAMQNTNQPHSRNPLAPPKPAAHAVSRDQRIAADLASSATGALLSMHSSERSA